MNERRRIIMNEKPAPIIEVPSGEIWYLSADDWKTIMVIGENGENEKEFDRKIPVYEEIKTNEGTKYQIKMYSDWIFQINWGLNAKNLGILFATYYPNVSYPAVLQESGQLLLCLEDENLNTNYLYPIEMLDDERIVINLGRYPDNYLSLYNMKTCQEESVYYDGSEEGTFAISSKGWLAIQEGLISDQILNVYDEGHNLVFSNNEVDNYYFYTWSGDGQKIAYVINKPKDKFGLYIHDFETGETSLIGENIFYASFSPDGERMVIQRELAEIYILDLQTMQEKYLTKGTEPIWKP
jgi:hypothetical protein